jgi:hypothetical protein
MNTQTIFSLQTQQPVATAISGDYSGVRIYIMNDLTDFLGGTELAFHEIKRLQNKILLPRMGGEGKPLTMLDLRYAERNERLGYRHWQWRSIVRGHTHYYGYGYVEENEFCFCRTSDDSVMYRVEVMS